MFRLQIAAIGTFALYDPTVPINRLAVPNKVWDSLAADSFVTNSEILDTADPLLRRQSILSPMNTARSWGDVHFLRRA